MRKSINKWRVNYVVIYQNAYFAGVYRKPVLDILQNIAHLRGIDCAVSVEHKFSSEDYSNTNTYSEDFVFDLVYFRSSLQTKIAVSDFRKMIDLVFEEQKNFLHSHVEVGAQQTKYIHQFHFPVK